MSQLWLVQKPNFTHLHIHTHTPPHTHTHNQVAQKVFPPAVLYFALEERREEGVCFAKEGSSPT